MAYASLLVELGGRYGEEGDRGGTVRGTVRGQVWVSVWGNAEAYYLRITAFLQRARSVQRGLVHEP